MRVTDIFSQLLEESGVISSDDARRAASNATTYQEITMEPLTLDDHDEGISGSDEDDGVPDLIEVDTSAVGRVRSTLL